MTFASDVHQRLLMIPCRTNRTRRIVKSHLLSCAVLAPAMVLLTGCGSGESGATQSKATQVAARVNGDEITIHQLNQALQRLGTVAPEQTDQAQQQVLTQLVEQQLLVQQAVERKLDRDPRVMSAVEAARRQILAQAYVEQVSGAAQTASSEQVQAFYAEHPELFEQRRVYRFAQVAVNLPAEGQAALRARLEELDKQADKSRAMLQLADWLKAQNLQFRATQPTQAAEQLPLDALPRYQKMNVGDFMYASNQQGVVVSQLIAAQPQPMNVEQARPFIEQYLFNRARIRASEEDLKRLRTEAKIEFMGAFAQMATTQASPPAPKAQEEPVAPAPAQDPMAKGLHGLK